MAQIALIRRGQKNEVGWKLLYFCAHFACAFCCVRVFMCVCASPHVNLGAHFVFAYTVVCMCAHVRKVRKCVHLVIYACRNM